MKKALKRLLVAIPVVLMISLWMLLTFPAWMFLGKDFNSLAPLENLVERMIDWAEE